MKVVSKKFGTTVSSVSVENSKELDFFILVSAIDLIPRLKVQNNADAVFIILPYYSIMSVCPVCNQTLRIVLRLLG